MLEQILEQKRKEAAVLKRRYERQPLPAAPAFDPGCLKGRQVQVIAEAKQASPSRGIICQPYDPVKLARRYQQSGAAAVSVLTESTRFLGDPQHLAQVSRAVDLPALRKDFILDEVQLYESVELGAAMVLLIAALHDYRSLLHLCQSAQKVGLEVLLETRREDEIRMAYDLPVRVVGINNRDLQSLQVDLTVSMRLIEHMRSAWIRISESGINSPHHMRLLEKAGFDAVLVGEALLCHEDPGQKLQQLLSYRGDEQ